MFKNIALYVKGIHTVTVKQENLSLAKILLFDGYNYLMPQNYRHRERVVPIEFNSNEDFSKFPLGERVSLVLITNGRASFLLNGKSITVSAPCIMLLS